jgi:hypothetical protein
VKFPAFDTKTFFEEQVTILSSKHAGLEKELSFTDKHQHVKIDHVNWKEELTPFIEIDFHKPSYNGRFALEKVNTAIGYNNIYQNIDPKTDLQKLVVAFDQRGNVSSIEAEYRENNSLYRAIKTLVYYTDSCYSISGKQEVTLGNSIEYSTHARIVSH